MSEYDMSIHTNPDAAAWARFFMETAAKHGWRIEGPDEATMLGWFANAMCAALDARSRALSPPETPATEGGADEFCGAPGPFQAVCDLTADHDGLHRGWSTEGRVDWRTGTRLCPSGAHYEGNCACTGAASPASAPRETPDDRWRATWVEGAAAVYRHEGRAPDRAMHLARWLLDVTHGPAAPPPEAPASAPGKRCPACYEGGGMHIGGTGYDCKNEGCASSSTDPATKEQS